MSVVLSCLVSPGLDDDSTNIDSSAGEDAVFIIITSIYCPFLSECITRLGFKTWPLQVFRGLDKNRLHLPILRRSTVGSRTFTELFRRRDMNDLPAHVTAAPSDSALKSGFSDFFLFVVLK